MTISNPGRRPDPASRSAVPQFTLGDRLRKAREYSGMEMQDLAAEIDIHRQTVARYESGQATPKRHVVLSWSLVTGVDLDWIQGVPETSTQVEQPTDSTDSESKGFYDPNPRGKTRVLMTWQTGK